jgi:tRNA pseudouridine38-40 synthase
MPRGNVRNIRLDIEYEGTDFCGWQKQPKVRTVEGELIRVLTGLVGGEPEIIAAARTDSGVHALGQVVNFSCACDLSPEEMRNALNSLLPPDVRITGALEVPLAFNARYDAVRRNYLYEITTRPTSVWRRHRWYVKYDLDAGVMGRAARSVVGHHDFSAYTCKDERRSPWIRLERAEVEGDPEGKIRIALSANRFLRRMVRMLTGTLVEIGRGSMQPGALYDILMSRNRDTTGPCAPPQGLYLVAVDF